MESLRPFAAATSSGHLTAASLQTTEPAASSKAAAATDGQNHRRHLATSSYLSQLTSSRRRIVSEPAETADSIFYLLDETFGEDPSSLLEDLSSLATQNNSSFLIAPSIFNSNIGSSLGTTPVDTNNSLYTGDIIETLDSKNSDSCEAVDNSRHEDKSSSFKSFSLMKHRKESGGGEQLSLTAAATAGTASTSSSSTPSKRPHKEQGEKRFACSQCPKRFPTSKDLKRHDVVHTGNREFQCSFCTHRFGRKDHRMRHEKKTHAAELLVQQQQEQLGKTQQKTPSSHHHHHHSKEVPAAKRPRLRHESSPAVLPPPRSRAPATSPPIIAPFQNMIVSSPTSCQAAVASCQDDLLSVKTEQDGGDADTDFLAEIDVGSVKEEFAFAAPKHLNSFMETTAEQQAAYFASNDSFATAVSSDTKTTTKTASVSDNIQTTEMENVSSDAVVAVAAATAGPDISSLFDEFEAAGGMDSCGQLSVSVPAAVVFGRTETQQAAVNVAAATTAVNVDPVPQQQQPPLVIFRPPVDMSTTQPQQQIAAAATAVLEQPSRELSRFFFDGFPIDEAAGSSSYSPAAAVATEIEKQQQQLSPSSGSGGSSSGTGSSCADLLTRTKNPVLPNVYIDNSLIVPEPTKQKYQSTHPLLFEDMDVDFLRTTGDGNGESFFNM